ncbi:MAG: rod shape-determining protein MreD [Acidimicrobiales bacterium]|nr:rod shape-determining protein MreD [Acidimicrobiales bacterium]MDP7117402.1 rod shape-determining protein MreD [Acidimicrobiales bacterium]MEE1521325.1 rod shape-determining protein MreD [Acidimicrobiales bacterium]MEE1570185.1 rod shape-determining protein MreD [Acidimicrobiales bacterium]
MVAVLLTALVAQATLLTEIRLQGATVELMMVIAILAGFHGGPERGALVAFFAGLLQDSLLSVPLGLHALVFPPLAVAVSSLEQRMVRSTPATDAVALLLATTAGIFTVAGVGLLFGLSPYDPETLLVRILTAAVMTTAIAAPVNRAVRWAVLGGLPPDIKLRTVGS